MTQGRDPRLASIPPAARPSAEHVRALAAAGRLDVRLFKKFAQRPLMSVWEAQDKSGQRVLLTAVDACGTPPERARVIHAAKALTPLAGTEGIQHVHRVLEEDDAFVADYLGAGAASDLVVLRWPPLRRLDFVLRVCDAIGSLHESGLVHGCLCPDNILMNDDLHPVLTEVGMVSVAESLGGDPENFFGYGAYAAPEAAVGTPDALCDIYSVGRLLSFVMLDETPEDPTQMTVLDAKLPELAPIVRRCTGAREQRFASMGELSAELHRVRRRLAPATGEIAKRPPEPTPPRPAPEKRAAPEAWAPPETSKKTAAPWWLPALCLLVLAGCVVAGEVLLVSGTLHVVLQAAAAAAAAGVSTVIPTTLGRRAALSVVTAVAAFLADPVGLLSRVEAADANARALAGRALVEQGGKDLRGKRFQGADFSRLDLTNAELGRADLTHANFAGAKLNRANVENTSLILANFAGADLTGVELEKAYGAETALCDAATVVPAGWTCNPDGKLRPGK